MIIQFVAPSGTSDQFSSDIRPQVGDLVSILHDPLVVTSVEWAADTAYAHRPVYLVAHCAPQEA